MNKKSNYLKWIVLSLFIYTSICLFTLAQNENQASRVYAKSSKSVLLLIIKSFKGDIIGQATGFVVTGGKIITNEHVVRSGNVIIDLGTIKLPAIIERVDEFNDLALLSVSAELALDPLPIANTSSVPGTIVYALGNPAGLEKSISSGILSGIRDSNGRQLIQITAPISPGSSGGPILNQKGEVIGVAVGILEKGQNLNFAVPSKFVQELILGKVQVSSDVLSIIQKADKLKQEQDTLEFSSDSDSNYQKLEREIDDLLVIALDKAGSDFDLLFEVAEKAYLWNTDISIVAAERATQAKPKSEAFLLLAKGLKFSSYFSEANEKASLLERAEKALRTAMNISEQPNPEIYYELAETLSNRNSLNEADTFYDRALELSKKTKNYDLQAKIIRGKISISEAMGNNILVDGWFASLVDLAKASAWDWANQGRRLDARGAYREAGNCYRQAAILGGSWTNWCEAAGSFSYVLGEEDTVLFCARKCITEGMAKDNSESWLSDAHLRIANILDQRGVFQEALSHAREAIAIDSSNAWAFNAQAEALIGLRRFQEAIYACNQAIRLSDGKYSRMHFNLGSAYFDCENWELARQSYEKASQLDSKDDAAPYNVALCLIKLGYFRDAANWYEEVLRRNPNHRERQEILNRILIFRR